MEKINVSPQKPPAVTSYSGHSTASLPLEGFIHLQAFYSATLQFPNLHLQPALLLSLLPQGPYRTRHLSGSDRLPPRVEKLLLLATSYHLQNRNTHTVARLLFP